LPQSPPADLLDGDATDKASMRFSLRTVPTPWQPAPPEFPVWKGAAAILGNNADAEALYRRLVAGGATVIRLSASGSPDEAAAEFERAWQKQPLVHLFIASHRDLNPIDRDNVADWDRVFQRRVLLPYFL